MLYEVAENDGEVSTVTFGYLRLKIRGFHQISCGCLWWADVGQTEQTAGRRRPFSQHYPLFRF